MSKLAVKNIGLLCLAVIVLVGCGGQRIERDPVKEIKRELNGVKPFTVLLHDMDLDGYQYKHKYAVLVPEGSSFKRAETSWVNVSDAFFKLHQKDLGMEVLSVNEVGRESRMVAPPGFGHLVGNEKYGQWAVGNNGRVWQFKEEYNKLRPMLGIDSLVITKADYDKYLQSYQYNRPYYGPTTTDGRTTYGTNGFYFFLARPLFFSRRLSKREFKKTGASTSHGFFRSRGGGGWGK